MIKIWNEWVKTRQGCYSVSMWPWAKKNIPIYSIYVNENLSLTNLIDVKIYSLTKSIFFVSSRMPHDINVNNLMFNTLGTMKILEIKNFLKSCEVCQLYWMVWGYIIIKDTNEKWQWMLKQQHTWHMPCRQGFQTKIHPTRSQKMVQIK